MRTIVWGFWVLFVGSIFGTSEAIAQSYPCSPEINSPDLKIYRSTETTVIVHHGKGDHTLAVGFNDLGNSLHVKCRSSAGCLLNVAVTIFGMQV